jgi:uncharacterized protein (TIGR01244 family)
MNVHFLEPEFAISDEITPEEFPAIREQGFKTVICNRRVGEEGYESQDVFLQAAEREGLQWVCVPVVSGEYTEADVEAFGKALDSAPTPILGFCRSGRRAVHMWAQSRAQDVQCNIPMLLKAAHGAGHDPQPIRELLSQQA